MATRNRILHRCLALVDHVGGVNILPFSKGETITVLTAGRERKYDFYGDDGRYLGHQSLIPDVEWGRREGRKPQLRIERKFRVRVD